MNDLTDRQRAVQKCLRTFDEGATAREVEDRLETDERGSDRYNKAEVRRALETLADRELATKDKGWPSRKVTYTSAGEPDGAPVVNDPGPGIPR